MSTVANYARSAEETLEVIAPWLKRAGVSRLADVTGLDNIGLPVFTSIRPDAKSLKVDSGKGTTRDQARCSAAMESLERWALDEVPIEYARQQTTDSRETSFQLNRGAQLTDFVRRSIKWTSCCGSTDGGVRSSSILRGQTIRWKRVPAREMLVRSTNGLAAASTREDAILGGLYEVIERDGVHLILTGAAQGKIMPRLDLTGIDSESADCADAIHSSGARVFVYDCRSEISVPCFMALIVDSECIGMWRGYGAHSCKEIALTRALCEAAQTRALLLACARDDILWKRHLKLISDSRAHNWIEVIEREEPTVNFADVSSLEGSVFDRMTEVGRRVLVVDFPLPEDAPFCVSKVLVPGLASYWQNYSEPGRP